MGFAGHFPPFAPWGLTPLWSFPNLTKSHARVQMKLGCPPCSLLCFPMCRVEVAAMGLVGAGAARPALEKASHGLTNLRLTLMFHHSQVRQSSRCPSLGQRPNPLPCALCLTQYT